MATETMINVGAFLDDYNMALNLKPEATETAEQNICEDFKKLVSMTNMSIKMLSTSYYKSGTYLEPSDIDQIKASLNNFAHKNQIVFDFKQSIIHDLTQFQKQIRENHIKEIVDITKQKQEYEKMAVLLEKEKEQLVRNRLAKMVWPYDAKTKEYDNKIAMTKARAEQFAQKVAALKDKKAAASEKDILVFQMQLKEKFAA